MHIEPKTKWTALLLGTLVLVPVVGCTEDTTTVGGQCRVVMDAYCSRGAYACDLLETKAVPDCIEEGTATCCTTRCEKEALSITKGLDECRRAIRSTRCEDLDVLQGGKVPPACVRVVKWGAWLLTTDGGVAGPDAGPDAGSVATLGQTFGSALSE